MWLVVGLGNPGPKYERNRHNLGFRVVDELARRHRLGPLRHKHGGELATGMARVGTAQHKVVLLKPMEFMNLSGHAVQRAASFHEVAAEHLVVVHDEADLDFGRLKLKSGGGHGGHNGLRSIIAQLGQSDFLRVRCGVGKPPGAAGARDGRVASYLLSDFPSAVAAEVDELVDAAANACERIWTDGIHAAMNALHGSGKPTATPAAPSEVRKTPHK